MSPRRPGGRPPLPQAERRDRLIAFRVRANEESRLRTAAKKAGLSLAEWLRLVTMRAAKPAAATRDGKADEDRTGGQGESGA